MPREHEIRYRQTQPDRDYWVKERYQSCNCPNCDDEYHWYSIMGGPWEFVKD